ncbi:hypothetical protein Aau02nite_65310 [Amorphoplanes auranticolor]|uniref:DDE family transposase n=1 Tax=Actinoplanes auranticolor TaxID=47988 RepID=A0A919SR29_9ACTN|nr:hypothetical protein Aau02nite_65310 [Actinoplanes auranticolor]
MYCCSAVSTTGAYDQRLLREEIRRRGITVRIARKGVEASHRLGRHRWIVEACLAWLLRNRRLIRRYDRKAEHFQAFARLACAPTYLPPTPQSHQLRHALNEE